MATLDTFGQAQALIFGTFISQVAIEVIYKEDAEFRATQIAIEVIYRRASIVCGQVTALIDSPIKVYSGNANAKILQVVSSSGQAKSQIKAFDINCFGQVQSRIKAFDQPVHAQAQAQVDGITNYAQAQAKINAFDVPQTGQALAFIGHFQSGNTQAYIKARVSAVSQALAYIGHFGVGLAQARLITFDVEGFGQAVAQIVKSAGYGHSQGTIKATVSSVSNTQAWILPSTDVGQAQASIKQTYPLMSLDANYALVSMGATASDSLEQTVEPYYTIDGDDYGFRWTIVGIAQDQYLQIDFNQKRTINYYRILPVAYDATVAIQIDTDPFPPNYNWSTVHTVPQFSGDIFGDVDTSRVVTGEIGPYTTDAVRIVVVDDGSNNGIALATVELGWATVKSGTFAQAAAMFGRFGVAQAQARVSPGFGIVYGQSKAQIVETFVRRGNAKAFIIAPTVVGNVNASVLQEYWAFAQVPFWIIPPTVIANAQATIKAYDVEGLGQAIASIEQTYSRGGQAQAHIHKLGGWAQTTAQIKASGRRGRGQSYGQARARVGNIMLGQAQAYIIKAQGYGQAKTSIKDTKERFAQARAQIFKPFGHALALARIKQVYRVYANAGAIMNQTFALAQSKAQIKQTYYKHAQANARLWNIATNFSDPYGLSQAMIYIRYYTQAQAQAWVTVRHNSTGNAMAFITPTQIGQAQARIFAFDYPRHAQAQARVVANPIIIPSVPSSYLQTYLVRYNNYDLPGYAQEEAYDSVVRIIEHTAMRIDGSLSEYLGLENKTINLRMKAWEPSYYEVKQKIQLAGIMLRSARNTFAKLYIQQADAYFLAFVKSIEVSKAVRESTLVLDYVVLFEAKPWLISNETYELSGTGLIDTGSRTIYDGGWTPTRILVSGTDISITAYTESGDPAGSIEIDGNCDNLIIDSENFTATENGINRNDILLTKDYGIYVGPGKTFFQIDGATSCVIQYQNRWYLASTRGVSTQTPATTQFPVIIVRRGTGLALAYISSGTLQVKAQARAVINDPIKKGFAQANADINSPIKKTYAQARAFLRSGRTWTFGQSKTQIRATGIRGLGQVNALIQGPERFKSAQARTTIRQHRKISTGLARAKMLTLPPAPSSLTATPGDEQVTLTWV